MGLKIVDESVIVVNVNEYIITSFNVNIPGKEIRIMYDYGSSENGIFSKIDEGMIKLTGQDFYSVAATMVDGSKNLYDNLKKVLYDKLMQKLGKTGTIV